MTAARDALERVLASLCAAETTAPFLARWGEARPSPLGGRRLRIDAPADPALARLDVRPWDEGAIGGVDVAFAEGCAPGLDELAAWLGGLRELVRMPEQAVTLTADWWREGLPVRAAVLVEQPPPGVPVVRLHARRGRFPQPPPETEPQEERPT